MKLENDDIAQNIKIWRTRRRMKQGDLAVEAGVEESTLSHLENGYDGKISTLLKLAKALKITAQLFLCNEADPRVYFETPTGQANGVLYEENSHHGRYPEDFKSFMEHQHEQLGIKDRQIAELAAQLRLLSELVKKERFGDGTNNEL